MQKDHSVVRSTRPIVTHGQPHTVTSSDDPNAAERRAVSKEFGAGLSSSGPTFSGARRRAAHCGRGRAYIGQPVWAAYRLARAADLCPIHSESAYPLTTVVLETRDDSMQVGDGRCHLRLLLYFGLIISRLG